MGGLIHGAWHRGTTRTSGASGTEQSGGSYGTLAEPVDGAVHRALGF